MIVHFVCNIVHVDHCKLVVDFVMMLHVKEEHGEKRIDKLLMLEKIHVLGISNRMMSVNLHGWSFGS